jgi:tetratricopeptide (TPR) repeat protein
MIRTEWIAAGLAGLLLVMASSVSVAEDEASNRFQKSVELETQEKYQEALSELEKISGPRAKGYMYSLRRGWLLYLLGKYDKSINAYQKALTSNSGSVEAGLGIMLPQLAARRWLDAEKTGLKILALDNANYLANSRLAYACYNLGRYADAAKYYKKVLDLYPGDIDMRSGYGWSLFKQGKYPAAKAEFKTILQVSPKHSAALEGIGLCP